MAAVYHNDSVDIELESGTVFRSFLNHTIGSGDNNANWYGVRVFRSGEPVNLTGCSVQGIFMPSSGSAILISDSTHTWVSENEAAVLLPQACYNIKGQFTLAIKIIGTTAYTTTGTVRIVDGVVADTYSENPVAPTATVPTYQEILAVYDQMVAAKDGSVRFDIEQELTAAQMTQARGNIAAASESDVSDLKSALTQLETDLGTENNTINRFNLATVVVGRIESDGMSVDTTITTQFTSDYVDVSDLNSITIGRFVNGGWSPTNVYYCKYSDIGSPIGQRTDGYTIDVSNVKYIRFSGSADYKNVFMVVSSDYDPISYIAYSRDIDFKFPTKEELEDISTSVENISASVSQCVKTKDLDDLFTLWVSKNILPPKSIIDNYYIVNSNGDLANNSGYFVSDFVDVDADKDYTFTTWYDDSASPQIGRYIVLFYDADKQPISSSYVNQSGVYYITATSPQNAKFIRVSAQKLTIASVDHTYMLEQNSTYGSRTKFETLIVFNDASNILLCKKWVACGDSFTHGDYTGLSEDNKLTIGRYAGQNKVYPFFIGNRNNMDIVNEAVNGSTMCLNDGTHNAFSTANGRYTQIPDDADYITLYFGINDGNYSSPIGTIDDTDNTTFYGAWNVVLDYLMRNHPFAKIGIIITNGTSMAYINAEKAVAEKWGIPYLDMNGIQTPVMNRSNNQSITNEVREFRTQMFSVNAPSNTHPSAKAHEYESTFIEAFLRRL